MTISAEYNDHQKKALVGFRWHPEVPFIEQFRLDPGEYTFRLQAPISSIGVNAKAATLTHIRLAPYREGDEVGVTAVVATGAPAKATIDLLEMIRGRYGYSFVPIPLSSPTKTFFLDTDPPWPIPPPPKK